MELAHPYLLPFALLAIPVALLAMRRRGAPHPVPSAAGLSGAPSTFRLRAARWLPALRVAAVLLLVVGLARPRAGRAEALVPAEGIDIALSLDISSSMDANSLGGGKSRLDVTREVIRDFIKGRTNDRIGLVVFQEDALPMAPLTLDYAALDRVVAEINSGILPDGTGIGVGLSSALTMLRDSPARSRIVILLTDGEHNAKSIHPNDAAAMAEALRIRVYTIGVEGATGARGHSFDEELLKSIASRTGGKYFLARSGSELADVYAEIGKLETSRLDHERYERFVEYGPWLALAGAALLLSELVLRGTWLRRATG